jgi:copper(I)-binding protein
MTHRVRSLLLVAAVTAAATAACGDDEQEFSASGAWARPTPTAATNGVIYLTVSTDVRDALIGVDVPPDVAAHTELHTSDAANGGGHQHGAVGDGTVTMEQVTEIVIDADATVEFRPGGNHIMLVDLPRPLRSGETFPATLRFGSGRTLDLTVTVADNPPP